MEDTIFQGLKKLQKIQPDPDYSRKSRFLILNSRVSAKKENWLIDILNEISARRLKIATSVAFVIILIMGGAYYVNQLKQDNLVVKAQKINSTIQVKLDEIKYILENTPLDPKNTPTLQNLLKEASDDLKEASELSTNDGVDLEKSLEKIKAAEETLLKTNDLLQTTNHP